MFVETLGKINKSDYPEKAEYDEKRSRNIGLYKLKYSKNWFKLNKLNRNIKLNRPSKIQLSGSNYRLKKNLLSSTATRFWLKILSFTTKSQSLKHSVKNSESELSTAKRRAKSGPTSRLQMRSHRSHRINSDTIKMWFQLFWSTQNPTQHRRLYWRNHCQPISRVGRLSGGL